MSLGDSLQRMLPILSWVKTYDRGALVGDLLASIIVTIMLIPQSLAYALLAGLPPEMGLYASILPLLAYAVFGTSRTLSVGPVAVVSLMTATAIGGLAEPGSADYIALAIMLAFLSGVFLVLLGLLRFGFLANFLSHPVVSGFITASGIIIAVSQIKHIFGISAHGENLLDITLSLASDVAQTNTATLVIGITSILFLFWVRAGLQPLLVRFGLTPFSAGLLAKTGPIFVVFSTTFAAWFYHLDEVGVALVGSVPEGLPSLGWPDFSGSLSSDLLQAAVLISIIGYVESVSVGKTLGAKRRQRIDTNQELVALGSSNIAAAVSGGFPVTGGFSRSVVNFDAGAVTPAAGVFTAVGIAIAALALTPLLAFLPKATLAATIIVAVLSLVDFSVLKKAWQYSKSDFVAILSTVLITLAAGVELGVLSGVVASICIHLYKTASPHIAEVGEIEGTEHFRNVKRFQVVTYPHIVSLRIDESLYFANASFLEDEIYKFIAERSQLRHVVLMCSAVNKIDLSALEVLEAINQRLNEQGIIFHLSEVKGPVMDGLDRTNFISHLTGDVFLTQHKAIQSLILRNE